MKWLVAFIVFAVSSGAASDQSNNCGAHLSSLRTICGTSPLVCKPQSLSDCVDRIRDLRGVGRSVLSPDFHCEDLDHFIRNHSCERKLDVIEKRYKNGFRQVRSPSAASIQKWRSQLQTDLHREVHTISQSNESCYHALYDNCLTHVSCRELWKIFRQLCTVDAQNQCQMTSKEDCWQSFEGISWTGLGTCTCFDDNSDCHWIRLQTNYNKCIYEILQGNENGEQISVTQPPPRSTSQIRPDNMYGVNKLEETSQSTDMTTMSKEQSTIPKTRSGTSLDDGSTYSTRSPPNSHTQRFTTNNGRRTQNRKENATQSSTHSREKSPHSSHADSQSHSHKHNGNRGWHESVQSRKPPSTASTYLNARRTGHQNNDPGKATTENRVRFNARISNGQRMPVETGRSEERRRAYSKSSAESTINQSKPSTTTTPATHPATMSPEEQRRNQHELFLKQQKERQLREEEYAEYKRRMAERKRQRERLRQRTRQRQEEKLAKSGVPTAASSTASPHIHSAETLNFNSSIANSTQHHLTSTTSLPIVSSTSVVSRVAESAQSPTTKRNRIRFPPAAHTEKQDEESNENAPSTQKKTISVTMRPPSWRLSQKLDLKPTPPDPPIVTTELLTTNLERPPTSSVMANVSTVKPKIRRLEENGNDDDEDENYGGGLHFHSDVIFSRTTFKPSEFTYNESTCNRAHKRCAEDEACVWHLSEVQMKCTLNEQCDRDLCAAAIQRFTQYVPKPLVESMMFCHCMVSDFECIEQQHWMYPRCLYAEQRDIGPITCTEAVEKCRSEANCEHYSSLFFQLCNSEGGQCTNADLDRCRQALIEVRATFLEFPCYCVQSDLDCRRIQNGMLPNNPCVEKSMIAYSRQLEDKLLEPFTRNPSTTINSNVIDPSTTALTATSNRTTGPLHQKFGGFGNNPSNVKLPVTSTEVPLRRTSTATTSGQKVKLEIEPENKNFSKAKYHLSAASRNGTQESTTRVPLIRYTSEELKDRKPMPEGGCYTKNSVGSWILHYKDTIIRKGLEWSGRCTSWCECDKSGELSCHSLKCLENVTCQVEDTAVYFGERLYLKDRGACTCCADNFVCQMPKNLEPLERGLYVFAGYSQKEVDQLREHVPPKIRERSGFVSAHRDVARDISSQLQQALERVMPLTEKCRLILLEHYVEEHIIMHQVQWYGMNTFGNDTKPKWHTGMLEKICSPYVRKLASIFEVNEAGRYQLVLSVVKQLKVVDMLDNVPESIAAPTVPLQLSIILLVSLAQYVF